MKRERLVFIIRILMKVLTDTRYEGLEHLPPQGKVIIATNHLSRVDIPVLACIPTRDDVIALVTDKYKDYPLFRFIVENTGCIWLDRTKADFIAFRAATEAINRGTAVGIAPEGTRSLDGKLLPGKPGAILLALKAGAPIVPVGISGSELTFPKLKRLQRARITARFGEPFTITAIDREDRDAAMQRATDEIMCRIAALLPPEYRGHYIDHPRLKELLISQPAG